MKFSRKIAPDTKPKQNFIIKKRLREDEIDFDKLRSYRLDRVKKELKKNIVITRGEKGAIAIKDSVVYECAAKKNLTIKDLTGAGDLFAAGYLHGIINGMSIEECLNKGTEMSSNIIQKIGARI